MAHPGVATCWPWRTAPTNLIRERLPRRSRHASPPPARAGTARTRRGVGIAALGLVMTTFATTGIHAAAPTAPATGRPPQAAATAGADQTSDELLEAARLKARAGATAEALAELRAANTLVKQSKGGEAAELLPILDMAAELLVADGQFAAAESPLKRSMAIREALVAKGVAVPDDHVAAGLAMLGTVRAARGGFIDAKPLLTRAVALFGKALGTSNPSTTATLLRLGEVCLALGEMDHALGAFRDTMDRALDRGGAADGDFSIAAARLARTLALAGRVGEGTDLLASALTDSRQAAGDRPELAPLLRELADLQLAAGDAGGAAATADDALEIDRSSLGDDHPAAAIDRLLRLRADVAAGDASGLDDADAFVARLAADAAQDSPLAAAGLRCAAALAADVQDGQRALDCWRRALETDVRLLGEDHADTAADRTGLARCLLEANAVAEARTLADRAVDALEQSRGPAHPETLAAVALAGVTATLLGDSSRAATLLDRLLAADAPRSGPRADHDLARLAEGVAAFKERAGDDAGAAAIRDAPLATRLRQFGETGPEVVAMLVQLADARHDGGAPEAAVPLYERAVSLASQAHGPDHPEVAAILTPLARSLRATNAHGAAAGVLARALAIWQATVGPDHPTTLATVKALALVNLALDRQEAALPLMTRLLAAYDADPSTPPADVARLVRKLGQIHEARGDADVARRYRARAEKLEKSAMTAVESPASGRDQDRR